MEKGTTIKVLDHGFVRLIDWMGDDKRILEAARISYKSPSKGDDKDKKLLEYLWKNKHTSPFEQCVITFDIKLPLFVQGQMVRHRTQRLNQVSARYTELSDEFYIPIFWRQQDNNNKQGSVGDFSNDMNRAFSSDMTRFCEKSYELYKSMIDKGVSREMARMVLPQNIYTEIYSQWDLHNLMHFFTLRNSLHAQYEIREYSNAMFKIFEELFPWCSDVYKKYHWEVKEIFND